MEGVETNTARLWVLFVYLPRGEATIIPMRTKQFVSTICFAGLLACGSIAGSKRVLLSTSTQTQTITIHQGGAYTQKKGKRLMNGDQLGEWTKVQVHKIDCNGNDVLLVWGQTVVRFPDVWPADEGLVIHGRFEDPPLRLTFPVPLEGYAKPVRDVVWSVDKLIIDGSPYNLASGDSYVFTEDGLEALSSDAADER